MVCFEELIQTNWIYILHLCPIFRLPVHKIGYLSSSLNFHENTSCSYDFMSAVLSRRKPPQRQRQLQWKCVHAKRCRGSFKSKVEPAIVYYFSRFFACHMKDRNVITLVRSLFTELINFLSHSQIYFFKVPSVSMSENCRAWIQSLWSLLLRLYFESLCTKLCTKLIVWWDILIWQQYLDNVHTSKMYSHVNLRLFKFQMPSGNSKVPFFRIVLCFYSCFHNYFFLFFLICLWHGGNYT